MAWLKVLLSANLALFFMITPSQAQQVSDPHISPLQGQQMLQIIATDGLKMFEFVDRGAGLFEQVEVEAALPTDFDEQMAKTSESAWFFPYTALSGEQVEPRLSAEVTNQITNKIGRDYSNAKFALEDGFKGRLKIIGSISDDDGKKQLFSCVLFVHPRQEQPAAEIVVVYPTLTYQAYSSIGEPSLYKQKNQPGHQTSVGLDRPFSLLPRGHTPMQHGIVEFLQKEKIDFDVTDNYHLHLNPSALDRYKLVILAGHDEYWTHEMRQTLEKHLEEGNDVLNISGNLFWFKVVFRDDRLYVNKVNGKKGLEDVDSWTGKYFRLAPTENTFGISYRYAGYPVSRKSKSIEEMNAFETQGDRMEPDDYDLRKDSMRIFRRDHRVFDGISSDVDWIGEGKLLLRVEIDGAPLESTSSGFLGALGRFWYQTRQFAWGDSDSEPDLTQRYRVPSDYLKKIDGELTVLADGWAIHGKYVRHVALAVEFNKPGRGKTISFGTIGWQDLLESDDDIALITRNAINYLMED